MIWFLLVERPPYGLLRGHEGGLALLVERSRLYNGLSSRNQAAFVAFLPVETRPAFMDFLPVEPGRLYGLSTSRSIRSHVAFLPVETVVTVGSL